RRASLTLAAEFHAGAAQVTGSISLLEVRSARDPAMRKQYKRKSRCCGLCKPHKAGWDHRWKPKERELMRAAEREMRRLIRAESSCSDRCSWLAVPGSPS